MESMQNNKSSMTPADPVRAFAMSELSRAEVVR